MDHHDPVTDAKTQSRWKSTSFFDDFLIFAGYRPGRGGCMSHCRNNGVPIGIR